MERTRSFDISSAALHILAMLLMLCDHLWATVIPGNDWLTCLGRIAFPIFAFMIVEGYFHTRNLKKYVLRLLLFAAVSEIPFNLICAGSVLYPFHQNVLWTFLLGLGAIHLNELARHKANTGLRLVTAAGTLLLGAVVGVLTMVDYSAAGVVTVLVFYFFRERTWWCRLCQLAALYYLNVEVMSGLYYELSVFGRTVPFVRQGLALLALIPIWLYHGRQGYRGKWFRCVCYGFYPAHMLLLWLIGQAIG